MRQTSELHKQLRTQTGSYYEVKVVRGDVTYGMDKLKSITIEQAMFDGNGPQISGVYSSQCTVRQQMYSNNVPATCADIDLETGIASWTGITFPLIQR